MQAPSPGRAVTVKRKPVSRARGCRYETRCRQGGALVTGWAAPRSAAGGAQVREEGRSPRRTPARGRRSRARSGRSRRDAPPSRPRARSLPDQEPSCGDPKALRLLRRPRLGELRPTPEGGAHPGPSVLSARPRPLKPRCPARPWAALLCSALVQCTVAEPWPPCPALCAVHAAARGPGPGPILSLGVESTQTPALQWPARPGCAPHPRPVRPPLLSPLQTLRPSTPAICLDRPLLTDPGRPEAPPRPLTGRIWHPQYLLSCC